MNITIMVVSCDYCVHQYSDTGPDFKERQSSSMFERVGQWDRAGDHVDMTHETC